MANLVDDPSEQARAVAQDASRETVNLFAHEALHATMTAAGRSDSMPFELGQVAETGFERENQILGGVFNKGPLRLSRGVVEDQALSQILNWPDPHIVRLYSHQVLYGLK